jgi:hypothetical protein
VTADINRAAPGNVLGPNDNTQIHKQEQRGGAALRECMPPTHQKAEQQGRKGAVATPQQRWVRGSCLRREFVLKFSRADGGARFQKERQKNSMVRIYSSPVCLLTNCESRLRTPSYSNAEEGSEHPRLWKSTAQTKQASSQSAQRQKTGGMQQRQNRAGRTPHPSRHGTAGTPSPQPMGWAGGACCTPGRQAESENQKGQGVGLIVRIKIRRRTKTEGRSSSTR